MSSNPSILIADGNTSNLVEVDTIHWLEPGRVDIDCVHWLQQVRLESSASGTDVIEPADNALSASGRLTMTLRRRSS